MTHDEVLRLVERAVTVAHGCKPDHVDVGFKGLQAHAIAHVGNGRHRYVVSAVVTPVDSTWHDENGRAVLDEDLR